MLEGVIQGIFSAAFLATILRVTTPILLPSLGALISGRAGVTNIGLEGTMLSAAFTGVIVSAYSQQWFGPETGQAIGPWLGLVSGVVVAMLMSLHVPAAGSVPLALQGGFDAGLTGDQHSGFCGNRRHHV